MAFLVPLQTLWNPFPILYFNSPRKSPKNTCLCVYMTFKSILACIHSFWSKTCVHWEMCIKPNFFGFFLIESRINWLLAFHIPWECSKSTLHFLFGVLYIEPLGYIEGGENWEKENYSPLFPHLLCLSLHPFVPLEHTMLLFPKLPFLCKISIVRWRIEVVEAKVEDFVSQVRRSVGWGCHYCIYVLLIEISISCPIHVHKYEYCIHRCIYFLIHDWLYMLE